ncbi:CRY [Mytilus edulis]|uniref:CRY n=1 Tax=Mytilus edulis TaxID=6550 RepID=A0A8S3QWM9_MYTED|nr:CRY [Mytilus edulis]
MADLGKDDSECGPLLFPGGESEGLKRLDTMMKKTNWVCKFEKLKTEPNTLAPSTTVLSPYLKFGCVSARTFYHDVQNVYRQNKNHTQPPTSLLGQLFWREFYYVIASVSPNFDKMEGNPICTQVDWDDNKEYLNAWREGKTGYPFIDAIMIQLKTEGWIHHLARHAVACFLTRGDLWCHWEEGMNVFEEWLLDADWCLNAGNWMWLSASAFFHQYFRVYSPIVFGKKTDKDGNYIRKYLPQLKHFPTQYIYEPWTAPLKVQEKAGCIIGKDYPKRIVEHDKVREKNIKRMAEAYKKRKEGSSKGVTEKRKTESSFENHNVAMFNSGRQQTIQVSGLSSFGTGKLHYPSRQVAETMIDIIYKVWSDISGDFIEGYSDCASQQRHRICRGMKLTICCWYWKKGKRWEFKVKEHTTTCQQFCDSFRMSIEIPDGSLVAVVGQVGCGKSSLLSAILGEMDTISGKVNVKGSMAYVAQQAWIQNTTLQNNILFGKNLNQSEYDKVLDGTALRPDLEILPGGDQTEIGEKGINLSGGQKQSQFSQSCLSGCRPFAEFLKNYLNEELEKEDLEDEIEDLQIAEDMVNKLENVMDDNKTKLLKQQVSVLSQRTRTESEMSEGQKSDTLSTSWKGSHGALTSKMAPKKQKSVIAADTENQKLKKQVKEKKKEEKLIQAEGVETGKVKLNVFMAYLRSVGLLLSMLIIFFYILYNAASIYSNIWLAEWSNDNTTLVNGTYDTDQRDLRLGIYGLIGIIQGIFIVISSIMLYVGNVMAGQRLHAGMLQNTMKVPIAFYDTTPLGRIMNRFSKDIDVLDTVIPRVAESWLACLLRVVSVPLIIGGAVFAIGCTVNLAGVYAGKILHCNLLTTILAAPAFFFDTTPVGRILNRFAHDTDVIDINLPRNFRGWCFQFLKTLTVPIVVGYSTPLFLTTIPPAIIVYYFAQGLIHYTACVDASRKLHLGILHRIMQAPMMFFDRTPTGRIINRFSRDVDVIDVVLPDKLKSWFGCLLKCISVPVVIGVVTPLIFAPLVPLAVLYIFVQVRFYSSLNFAGFEW